MSVYKVCLDLTIVIAYWTLWLTLGFNSYSVLRSSVKFVHIKVIITSLSCLKLQHIKAQLQAKVSAVDCVNSGRTWRVDFAHTTAWGWASNVNRWSRLTPSELISGATGKTVQAWTRHMYRPPAFPVLHPSHTPASTNTPACRLHIGTLRTLK